MTRPENLPEFASPPLSEVVMGVQFDPVSDFQSFDAYHVWSLFSGELPTVEEQPALPPAFETFGGSHSQQEFKIQITPGPSPIRFWFVSEEGNHLAQFQSDRFLLNWRKSIADSEYPRFEMIQESFQTKLRKFESFLRDNKDQELRINQAELSYINVLKVDDFSSLSDWLSIWNCGEIRLDGINLSFAETMSNADRQPFARLHHEITSAYSKDGDGKAFRFNLTFRGKPSGNKIDDALEFISSGRAAIVNRFTQLTTSAAHKVWERQK